MDQPRGQRPRGVEALTGDEHGAGEGAPDLADGVGRDDRRDDAEQHLGEPEGRGLGADGDVADGREAGAAAQRVAVDAADERLRQLVQRSVHRVHARGVGDVLVERPVLHRPHPVEVGAGAEHGAGPGEDDDPDRVVGAQGLRGARQLGDERRVEGVADLGAVHGDGGDAAGVAGDPQGGEVVHGRGS